MSERVVSVRLEVKNEAVRKDLEEAISPAEFHLHAPDDPDPCDLLILEPGEDAGKDLEFIQALQASGRVKEVFLTSPHFDPDLLLQAFRAGVKEFFAQPIKREEVRKSLSKFRERTDGLQQGRKAEKRGKMIYLAASKGGVGTTTIAVNLATGLSESSSAPSVILVDTNPLFGQIPVFLNMEPSFNWGDMVRNISRVDATYLMSTLSRHHSGVYVLPAPGSLEDVNIATPAMVEGLLNLMRTVFDFIVIDGGQRLDEISFKILEMVDTVSLVAVLDLPCLTNVRRLFRIFNKVGFPPKETIKMIANRCGKKYPISLKDAEQGIGEKIHWAVPDDYAVTMAAINQGKPISWVAPGSEINKSLREFADSFLPKEQKKRNGFWQWIPQEAER